jgi:RNA polymerase sigma factor (sigma-70 family)
VSDNLVVHIVDDDAAVRDSLSLLFSVRGYRTATFASAEDFLRAVDPSWAGCIVADIRMPGMSGLQMQEALAARGIEMPVIIITAHGDVSAVRAAFKASAIDFLEKPFDDDEPLQAVESAFGRERARLGLVARREHDNRALDSLTPREREVLELLVRGLHNREVAESLAISARTVEVHKARIMAKLDARNVADLIRIAGT